MTGQIDRDQAVLARHLGVELAGKYVAVGRIAVKQDNRQALAAGIANRDLRMACRNFILAACHLRVPAIMELLLPEP